MYQSEKCARCNQAKEETLMLSCVHDLCLNCAALQYQQESLGKRNHNLLTCRFCSKRTSLDLSSVYQLQKLAYSLKKGGPQQSDKRTVVQTRKDNFSPHSKEQRSRYEPVKVQKEYKQQFKQAPRDQLLWKYRKSQEFKPKDYRDNQKPISFTPPSARRICPSHDDEELTYFCHDCLKGICPQCAIHGQHNGHQVEAVKRAAPTLKKKIQSFDELADNSMRALNSLKERSIKQQRSKKEQHEKDIAGLRKLFAQIRQTLSLKEKALEKKISSHFSYEVEKAETKVTQIQREVVSTEQTQRQLRTLASSSDLQLTSNFHTVHNQLQQQRQQLSKSVEKFGCHAVKQLEQAQLDEDMRKLMSFISAVQIRFE